MAMVPQVGANIGLAQPAPANVDIFPKANFGAEFATRRSTFDADQAFERLFNRVHRAYGVDTTNIEKLAERLLQEDNPELMKFVQEETLLRDTFWNRFFEVKTPLGQVLQELQNSQESPNRKLLPKATLMQAENEAGALIAKDRALSSKKGVDQSSLHEAGSPKRRQAPGAIKIGSEFQVNANASRTTRSPSTARLINDKFVVTWTNDWLDGNFYGVFGQIFNSDGTKSGSEFQVNTYSSSHQSESSIAALSNGKFVVTWTSNGQDGDAQGVFGQIFNPTGSKSGSEFRINTYTNSSQELSSVAGFDFGGGFVVTWTSYLQDGDGYGVFGQIFDSLGGKIGSEFQVNTDFIGHQTASAVTNFPRNRFVVVWYSFCSSSCNLGIYGQIFNIDGSKRGNDFLVNTFAGASHSPSVTNLRNGKFVVAWTSPDQDGDFEGIFGQIFNEIGGTKSGSEFQVNTFTTSYQNFPSTTELNDGKFVIAWASRSDGDGYGIFGQVFMANGTKYKDEFQINTITQYSQKYPSVANLGNDTFVVTWEGGPVPNLIEAQRFTVNVIPTSSTSSTLSTSSTSSSRTSSSRGFSTYDFTSKSISPTTVISGAERQRRGLVLTGFERIYEVVRMWLCR